MDKTSVAIKNGNREGITEFAHSFKPDFAACMLLEENRIRHIKNSRNIPGSKFRLILNTNILKGFI